MQFPKNPPKPDWYSEPTEFQVHDKTLMAVQLWLDDNNVWRLILQGELIRQYQQSVSTGTLTQEMWPQLAPIHYEYAKNLCTWTVAQLKSLQLTTTRGASNEFMWLQFKKRLDMQRMMFARDLHRNAFLPKAA